MKQERLFEIIYLLLQHKTMTAKALAERFEVSSRTIYRDMDALSAAGIPVYTSKGKNGGISLLEDFVLDKSLLSASDKQEIATALHSLQALSYGQAGVETNLSKLGAVLGQTQSWVAIDFSGWEENSKALFQLLRQAIVEHRVVCMQYYGSNQTVSTRKIEPMQLLFKHREWYLYAYCLQKEAIRMFKLTRMHEVVLTGETFAPRDFSEIELWEKSMAAPSAKAVELTLKITPQMAFLVYEMFEARQIQKQEDGSFIAQATYPEDNWLYGFLLSFGEGLEVLQPASVRTRLKEALKKIAQIYN